MIGNLNCAASPAFLVAGIAERLGVPDEINVIAESIDR